MKEKIIEMLKDRKEIPITSLIDEVPNSRGDLAMYIPVHEGNNPNVFIAIKVNEEFIMAYNELKQANIIDILPTELYFFLFEGAPIIKAKICTYRMMKSGKSECWLPVMLVRGINFPKL